MTRRLPVLLPLTLLVLSVSGWVSTPAGADPAEAPVLTVSVGPSPDLPVRVPEFQPGYPPLPPDECEGGEECEDDVHVFLEVSSSAPVDGVTATVTSYDGLYVGEPVQTIGSLPDEYNDFARWTVAARTPGFHTMTIEVTADGAEPVEVSLPYLWRPGGPPVAATGSLGGRLFGRNGEDWYQCGIESQCDYRYSRRVEFVDGARMHYGLAHEGHIACTRPCSSYRYDAATGLVQVGKNTIGRVTDDGLYLDGEWHAAMAYPRVNRRLAGTWDYTTDAGEWGGVGAEHLVLTSGGRFDLTYSVDTCDFDGLQCDRYSSHLSGRYRVAPHGRLVLTDPHRHLRKIATIALLTDADGTPQARRRGVWLDLTITPRHSDTFVSGNLLSPVG